VPVPEVKLLAPEIVVLPFRDTAPVPVEKVTAPVWVMAPPAKVEVPVPTLKVLLPVTEVLPFKDTAPVPVPKVVAPDWEILPEVVSAPVLMDKVLAPEIVTLPLKVEAWETVRAPALVVVMPALPIVMAVAVEVPTLRVPAAAVSREGLRTEVSAYKLRQELAALPRSIVLSALGSRAVLMATEARLDRAVLAQVAQVPAPPATPPTSRQRLPAVS
jgi:hypothetical protein